MPKREQGANVSTDAHFDGEQEGVINDNTGKAFGIQTNNDTGNPYHVKSLKKNPAFEKLDPRHKD